MVVFERRCQVMHPFRQRRLVGIGRLQILAAIDRLDRSLPRVVGPEPQLTRAGDSAEGVAHGLFRGQEHHLVDARHLVGHTVVIARGLVADGQPLQVHGIVKGMLADVGGLLRQDDRLQRLAEVEHIFAHLVVVVEVVVEAIALVRMFLIFLQTGVIQIQVAQTAVGRITVVHVGTGQEAQHAHVDTIQRTAHGQRVDVPVGTLQVHQIVAVHDGLQSELFSQLANGGGGHLLREGLLTLIGHDIVLILAPRPFIVINGSSGHVDFKAVVWYPLITSW